VSDVEIESVLNDIAVFEIILTKEIPAKGVTSDDIFCNFMAKK